MDGIIGQILQKLALPEILKIDPNSQTIPDVENLTVLQRLTQATVPAVLLGITNISFDSEAEASNEQARYPPLNVREVFPINYEQIVESIADYSGSPRSTVHLFLEEVIIAVDTIIQEEVGTPLNLKQVRDYVIKEKHKIFFYLPAQLKIGALMGDASLDDRTKKMEGPFSNILHKIEDGLSKPE